MEDATSAVLLTAQNYRCQINTGTKPVQVPNHFPQSGTSTYTQVMIIVLHEAIMTIQSDFGVTTVQTESPG